MEAADDNDDSITKPKMKKERKPMTEETLKKLADARAVVAANRAAKKKELEDAKAIVKANKEKAAVAESVQVAPSSPPKKPAKKAPVIVQEEESDDEAPVVIIKKKKKQPKVVYESASESEEDEMPPAPTPRATKSQQNKSTKHATAPEKPVQRYYFA